MSDLIEAARQFRTKIVGPELSDKELGEGGEKVDDPLAAQVAQLTALVHALLDALDKTIDVDAVLAAAGETRVDKELVAKVAGAVGWSWEEADRVRVEYPEKWAAILADLGLTIKGG